MVKPRGSICNLGCQYCYYLKKEKLYPDAQFIMSDELLEQYIVQYINAQTAPEVIFAWQGGEPTLMGLDFFRKVGERQARHLRPGMRLQNTFQTNGTLLDEAWCEFFRQHNFLIGLSIDGPQALHDAYRRDKGDHPTFARVLHAAELLKRQGVEFNTLTCVHAANAGHGLEVYRFLRDELGSRFMQFIPIVERANETGFQEGARVTGRSVNGPQYGDFLIEIFDEWVRHDVGQVFVQLFDVSLAVWVGARPGLCIFEETCGLGLALEFNGDLYSCDHYVEPNYLLGNLADHSLESLVMDPRQFQFGRHKKDSLPAYCRECEVRFICNGGCPKDRMLKTPDGEPGLNYLCAGYRAFFNYIGPSMKVMAALLNMQRPAEEIMRMPAEPPLREQPTGAACPCGSGKPVEDCHRAPHGFVPPRQLVPPPSKIQISRNRH